MFVSALIITGCSKSNEPAPEPEPPVVPGSVAFNKLITVSNFGEALPEGSQPLDDQAPIYFSLENNGSVPLDYKRTSRWDVSFAGTYRSFMGGNNGSNPLNLGTGGPGKGGIMVLEKNFDQVTDVPTDEQFKTGSTLIGADASGAYGMGTGYYYYDFDGKGKGDGSYEYQHVAYALQDTRTVIVRTANGNYAKIKMQSIYKDLLDPATWRRNSPHPYFSFQYVLAKAGSKKFTIDK
ncbi:HmuY family protein [Pedobacter sp. ISL-68]|nr:HmuY family protein [Pedobacter sp. ISL-64]MBT2589130.1 HmuY family protein [Pedobacter sp. ISL-68]